MSSALDYPHLVSLALIVAISTLVAGWWAERRREAMTPSQNLFVELLIMVAFMLFYSFVAFLLPAIIVASLLWAITSVPETTPAVVMGETAAQLATLFSIGANFADVASTYGQVTFWKHMRQYLVLVLPAYYATMALAWVGAEALARVGRYRPGSLARSSRLFALPFLAPQPGLNLWLCASLLLGTGAVSYLLRKRGEQR